MTSRKRNIIGVLQRAALSPTLFNAVMAALAYALQDVLGPQFTIYVDITSHFRLRGQRWNTTENPQSQMEHHAEIPTRSTNKSICREIPVIVVSSLQRIGKHRTTFQLTPKAGTSTEYATRKFSGLDFDSTNPENNGYKTSKSSGS